MNLRWYEYRIGATWVKLLQYQTPTGKWINVPTIIGEHNGQAIPPSQVCM